MILKKRLQSLGLFVSLGFLLGCDSSHHLVRPSEQLQASFLPTLTLPAPPHAKVDQTLPAPPHAKVNASLKPPGI